MSDDEEGIRVKLAEIAGGVKLIDSKIDASNRIQDERFGLIQTDIKNISARVHHNANNIQSLFGWKHTIEGERKGVAFSGRAVWAVIGLIGGGGAVTALMRLFSN